MFREFVQACLGMARDIFRGRAKLIAENALLRQQVVVLKRGASRPRLKPRDRWTMAAITKVFPALLDAVIIVRPETVIRWHRSLWRLLWRHRSRRPAGRPPVDADTRALIRRMWQENPLWGEDVIAAELAKLGHYVSPWTLGLCHLHPWQLRQSWATRVYGIAKPAPHARVDAGDRPFSAACTVFSRRAVLVPGIPALRHRYVPDGTVGRTFCGEQLVKTLEPYFPPTPGASLQLREEAGDSFAQ